MSLIDKEINDFDARTFQNNSFKTVNREDLRGKWSAFFLYSVDSTFVCPIEFEDPENNYAAFWRAGCEIYSVSYDTHFVYKAWHGHSERISEITYPMFTNPTQALTRDFEALIPEADLVERGTPIVNPNLKIITYGVNAGNVGRNAKELLHKVQTCQFVRGHGDEARPVEWTPGVETLKLSLDLIGAL